MKKMVPIRAVFTGERPTLPIQYAVSDKNCHRQRIFDSRHIQIGSSCGTATILSSSATFEASAWWRQFETNNGAIMNSAIIKRSVVVAGKKTSVSLEDTFWLALKEIAAERRTALSIVLNSIADGRDTANLSSAVRQYVMQHFYDLAVRTPRAAGRPELVVHSATRF